MHSLFFDTTDRYHRLVQLKKNNQVIDEITIITKKGDKNKQSNHYDIVLHHNGTKGDHLQAFQGDILTAIKTILKRNNLKLEKISKMNPPSASSFQITTSDLKIKANPGPGSFTGIRVGLSIANALNYGLGNIKNFKKDLQMPHYGGEPQVTIKKDNRKINN